MEVALLLHNIRSGHNVGSILRTADAAGVSRVYLTGYSPAPLDRFGREQKEIAKSALGAHRFVSWEQRQSPAVLITALKKEGFRIVGVEQDKRSKDYRDLLLRGKTLFVFGNEVRGISKELLARCDEIVEIPMRGKKESLNVSVAAGVVLFSALSTKSRRQ